MNNLRPASLSRFLFSLLLALPLAVGAQTPAPASIPTPTWITPGSAVTTVNLTDIKGAAAATLKAGDKARVLGSDEDYYKVQFGDGPELYVLKKLVTPATPPAPALPTTPPPPPVLLTGADKGSPVSAPGGTPEKSHFARNWGWYVGGLAVVGGAAAAAGGGGGGSDPIIVDPPAPDEPTHDDNSLSGTYRGQADFGDRVIDITITISGSKVRIADSLSTNGSSGSLSGTSFTASAVWTDSQGQKTLDWSGTVGNRRCSGSCTATGPDFTTNGSFSANK